MSAVDAMVAGYFAGLSSGADMLPECHQSKPASFRHGWLNGRDDRHGKPRERADVLRRRAEMMLGVAA